MDHDMDQMRTKMGDLCEAYYHLERAADEFKIKNNH